MAVFAQSTETHAIEGSMQLVTYQTQCLAFHGLAAVVSLGPVIIGWTIASHRVPDQKCVGYTSGGQEDGDGLSKAALVMGVSAIAAGVIAVFGGSFGFAGALMRRRRFIAAALFFFGVAFVAGVVSIAANFLAGFNGCADYRCANETICYRSDTLVEEDTKAKEAPPNDEVSNQMEQLVETGVRSMCSLDDNRTDCNFEYICKPLYDSLCEWDSKPLHCFLVTLVALLSMSVACCYGCGAAQQLDLGADTVTAPNAVQVMQGQGVTIVGQPAASNS